MARIIFGIIGTAAGMYLCFSGLVGGLIPIIYFGGMFSLELSRLSKKFAIITFILIFATGVVGETMYEVNLKSFDEKMQVLSENYMPDRTANKIVAYNVDTNKYSKDYLEKSTCLPIIPKK